MFVKGKSINDDGKSRQSSNSPGSTNSAQKSAGNAPGSMSDAGNRKPQKPKRKSIIRSLRNSLIAMTGAGGSKSEDAQVKKKMAAKKEEDARRERCASQRAENCTNAHSIISVSSREAILIQSHYFAVH